MGPKDVAMYEGQYLIHPDGRVWSVPRKASRFGRDTNIGGMFLKQSLVGATGFPAVRLSNPAITRPVHRLVAHAFLPGKFAGAVVGFRDGDHTNPHIDNLEWITRAESMRRAVGRPKKVKAQPPPRRASGALDVWDEIPVGFLEPYPPPLPWEASNGSRY